ncbi:MAG: DUF3035 domain-containing protein [Acetobacteraceae bacterium]|nr:DUF3035 domain-containing protein [Acetobacteraceae bacterium]
MTIRRAPAAAPRLAALAAVTLLGACGPDTARNFGFTRDPPDEFQVTTRAPLSMPPSLTELPTPRPGATRPQELSQRQAAEAALAPSAALGVGRAGRQTSGETALLTQAGQPVGDDIRRRVDEENLRLERTDRGLVDRLMFWREPPPPGIPVDATRESRRLRENAALGRDPTEGETPVVQPTRSGNPITRLLESLF